MNLNDWVTEAHANSKAHGFYDGGAPNLGEKIALMHSELSELLEAIRKDPFKACDKCPEITIEEEEVADLFIRLADYCGLRAIDLESAVRIKHEFNKGRPYKHGKRF